MLGFTFFLISEPIHKPFIPPVKNMDKAKSAPSSNIIVTVNKTTLKTPLLTPYFAVIHAKGTAKNKSNIDSPGT